MQLFLCIFHIFVQISACFSLFICIFYMQALFFIYFAYFIISHFVHFVYCLFSRFEILVKFLSICQFSTENPAFSTEKLLKKTKTSILSAFFLLIQNIYISVYPLCRSITSVILILSILLYTFSARNL